MKKLYIEPTVNVVSIRIENLLTTSQLQVGETMSTGSGDARSVDWDDED